MKYIAEIESELTVFPTDYDLASGEFVATVALVVRLIEDENGVEPETLEPFLKPWLWKIQSIDLFNNENDAKTIPIHEDRFVQPDYSVLLPGPAEDEEPVIVAMTDVFDHLKEFPTPSWGRFLKPATPGTGEADGQRPQHWDEVLYGAARWPTPMPHKLNITLVFVVRDAEIQDLIDPDYPNAFVAAFPRFKIGEESPVFRARGISKVDPLDPPDPPGTLWNISKDTSEFKPLQARLIQSLDFRSYTPDEDAYIDMKRLLSRNLAAEYADSIYGSHWLAHVANRLAGFFLPGKRIAEALSEWANREPLARLTQSELDALLGIFTMTYHGGLQAGLGGLALLEEICLKMDVEIGNATWDVEKVIEYLNMVTAEYLSTLVWDSDGAVPSVANLYQREYEEPLPHLDLQAPLREIAPAISGIFNRLLSEEFAEAFVQTLFEYAANHPEVSHDFVTMMETSDAVNRLREEIQKMPLLARFAKDSLFIKLCPTRQQSVWGTLLAKTKSIKGKSNQADDAERYKAAFQNEIVDLLVCRGFDRAEIKAALGGFAVEYAEELIVDRETRAGKPVASTGATTHPDRLTFQIDRITDAMASDADGDYQNILNGYGLLIQQGKGEDWSSWRMPSLAEPQLQPPGDDLVTPIVDRLVPVAKPVTYYGFDRGDEAFRDAIATYAGDSIVATKDPFEADRSAEDPLGGLLSFPLLGMGSVDAEGVLPSLQSGQDYRCIPFWIGVGGLLPPALAGERDGETNPLILDPSFGEETFAADVIHKTRFMRRLPVGAPRISLFESTRGTEFLPVLKKTAVREALFKPFSRIEEVSEKAPEVIARLNDEVVKNKLQRAPLRLLWPDFSKKFKHPTDGNFKCSFRLPSISHQAWTRWILRDAALNVAMAKERLIHIDAAMHFLELQNRGLPKYDASLDDPAVWEGVEQDGSLVRGGLKLVLWKLEESGVHSPAGWSVNAVEIASKCVVPRRDLLSDGTGLSAEQQLAHYLRAEQGYQVPVTMVVDSDETEAVDSNESEPKMEIDNAQIKVSVPPGGIYFLETKALVPQNFYLEALSGPITTGRISPNLRPNQTPVACDMIPLDPNLPNFSGRFYEGESHCLILESVPLPKDHLPSDANLWEAIWAQGSGDRLEFGLNPPQSMDPMGAKMREVFDNLGEISIFRQQWTWDGVPLKSLPFSKEEPDYAVLENPNSPAEALQRPGAEWEAIGFENRGLAGQQFSKFNPANGLATTVGSLPVSEADGAMYHRFRAEGKSRYFGLYAKPSLARVASRRPHLEVGQIPMSLLRWRGLTLKRRNPQRPLQPKLRTVLPLTAPLGLEEGVSAAGGLALFLDETIFGAGYGLADGYECEISIESPGPKDRSGDAGNGPDEHQSSLSEPRRSLGLDPLFYTRAVPVGPLWNMAAEAVDEGDQLSFVEPLVLGESLEPRSASPVIRAAMVMLPPVLQLKTRNDKDEPIEQDIQLEPWMLLKIRVRRIMNSAACVSLPESNQEDPHSQVGSSSQWSAPEWVQLCPNFQGVLFKDLATQQKSRVESNQKLVLVPSGQGSARTWSIKLANLALQALGTDPVIPLPAAPDAYLDAEADRGSHPAFKIIGLIAEVITDVAGKKDQVKPMGFCEVDERHGQLVMLRFDSSEEAQAPTIPDAKFGLALYLMEIQLTDASKTWNAQKIVDYLSHPKRPDESNPDASEDALLRSVGVYPPIFQWDLSTQSEQES